MKSQGAGWGWLLGSCSTVAPIKRFSTLWGALVPLGSWALAHKYGMAVSRSLFVSVVLLLPWRTEGPVEVESFNFFEF